MNTIGRINELPIVQGNHSPGDSISLPRNCVKVTVRNEPASGATLYVSWNISGSKINALLPGESVSYFHDGIVLDGNELYCTFDESASGGLGLVSMISDTKRACE